MTAGSSLAIFAGAGCSIEAPASLPSWFDMNDAILGALFDRLESYNLPNRIRGEVLGQIRAKRAQYSFPPDYQAQVMVERAGMKYFELLTVVDSNAYNAFHYYTAQAARNGLVRAVVTTNFDQNFERALDEASVPFQAFIDETDFDAFEHRTASKIPIIKVHGSCSSPQSMVDTRKQRLKGRAKSLERALASLLQEHSFLFAGFSGADLDDNENYLGLRDAAPSARGLVFLHQPTSVVRDSVKKLLAFYGKEKATSVGVDATSYLQETLTAHSISCSPFSMPTRGNPSFTERLWEKVQSLDPMDAANMMFALAEANGDEPAARYLYDRVWKGRQNVDYESDSFDRFLLNHGRSYVFNFQDKVQRAAAIEVGITQMPIGETPEELRDYLRSPAKANLKHQRNTSPETVGLIALVQTYCANPILFDGFPTQLTDGYRRAPTLTEVADIIYYYSIYALIHAKFEVMPLLNAAIKQMEDDRDEPRLCQLLCRRAMLVFRDTEPEAAKLAERDAARARDLAAKYKEPHLLALSALAMSIGARKQLNCTEALRYVQEAERTYRDLKRFPQYIESMVEYLKVLQIGFRDSSEDPQLLLRLLLEIESRVDELVFDLIPAFEPEFCYLMGMNLNLYTDAPRERWLPWLADAVSLSNQFDLAAQNEYFRETCTMLGVMQEIDDRIASSRAGKPQSTTSADTE